MYTSIQTLTMCTVHTLNAKCIAQYYTYVHVHIHVYKRVHVHSPLIVSN